MICTLLSRVLEDFHRIPWTVFLATFMLLEKANNDNINYENTINPNKAFFLLSV